MIADHTGKKTYTVEYRLLTRDRGWRWFQSAGRLSRRPDGSPITYVGILVDITNQRLTDEMLNTQNRLLKDALEQSRKAKKARSIFFNNISHDLRTPMNAITGFATLAKLSLDDQNEISNCLDKILSSSNDLQALITSLLEMSYIESGEVSINKVRCSLPDILWDVEASARAEAKARQLKLSVGIKNLEHCNVLCNQQKLTQSLMYVVDNSLKFTPAGGQIRISLTESPGAAAGCGFYTFRIQDTGIGMNKKFLERIFEPFEQAHPVPLDGRRGMGLGMTIVQNIMEKMGGTVRIESEEGKGTLVSLSIQFPLAEQHI